jgi:hypothetical protein
MIKLLWRTVSCCSHSSYFESKEEKKVQTSWKKIGFSSSESETWSFKHLGYSWILNARWDTFSKLFLARNNKHLLKSPCDENNIPFASPSKHMRCCDQAHMYSSSWKKETAGILFHVQTGTRTRSQYYYRINSTATTFAARSWSWSCQKREIPKISTVDNAYSVSQIASGNEEYQSHQLDRVAFAKPGKLLMAIG